MILARKVFLTLVWSNAYSQQAVAGPRSGSEHEQSLGNSARIVDLGVGMEVGIPVLCELSFSICVRSS
jgi:hypothetical protein